MYLLLLTIGFLFCIVIMIYMYYKAHHDTVDYRNVTLKTSAKKETSLNLFFISDIHNRVINRNTLKTITMDIDIVIIGGDLVERGVPLENVTKNITLLQSIGAPIFFVWGNNDYEVDVVELTDLLHQKGVAILKNSSSNFTFNSRVVSLIGLDCCKMREAKYTEAVQHAIGDIKILVTHHPNGFFMLTDDEIKEIDFALSGHTHGGQIRILGIGPYSKGGYKQYLGKTILISEGYGYTKLPFRLGTRSQCHVISFSL